MTSVDIARQIIELSRMPQATLYVVSGWISLPILQIDVPAADAHRLRVTVRAAARQEPVDARARARLEAAGFGDVRRLEPCSRVLEFDRTFEGAQRFAEAAARWWLSYDALSSVWPHQIPNAGKPMALVTCDAVRIDSGHIGVQRDLDAVRCLHSHILRCPSFTGCLGTAPVLLRQVRESLVEVLQSLLEMAAAWRGDVENRLPEPAGDA